MVVVAAIDESEEGVHVVTEAAKLASQFDTELYVVHVITQSEYTDLLEDRSQQWDSLEPQDVQDIVESVVAEAVATVDREYTVVPLVGDEADEIVEYAGDVDAEYLVVGGRRRSPAGKALLGSVSQSVLLLADRPVVSVIRD